MNYSVLIIDDFALARHTIRVALSQMGVANVLEAKNGQEGLDVCVHYHQKENPVRLIISDLNMPEMTGLQLLRRLRSDKRFETLPFVMMTVEGEETLLAEIMSSGAADCFVKPFSFPVISQKLKPFLDKLANK